MAIATVQQIRTAFNGVSDEHWHEYEKERLGSIGVKLVIYTVIGVFLSWVLFAVVITAGNPKYDGLSGTVSAITMGARIALDPANLIATVLVPIAYLSVASAAVYGIVRLFKQKSSFAEVRNVVAQGARLHSAIIAIIFAGFAAVVLSIRLLLPSLIAGSNSAPIMYVILTCAPLLGFIGFSRYVVVGLKRVARVKAGLGILSSAILLLYVAFAYSSYVQYLSMLWAA